MNNIYVDEELEVEDDIHSLISPSDVSYLFIEMA